MTTKSCKTDQLLEAVVRRRALVLNIVESEVGKTSAWRSLRSRLLGAFGENGLARDVKRIMADTEEQGGHCGSRSFSAL